MERYPLRIKWRNPDTGYMEVFEYGGTKGNFIIYIGRDSLREIMLTPEQALRAERA